MSKVLYTNGCSHTRGTEISLNGQLNLTWPNLLSKHLNYDLIDESTCGSSNDSIFRRTLEYILSSPIPPNKAVIQFTVYHRFDIGHRTLLPRTSLKYTNSPYNEFYKDFFSRDVDLEMELSHSLLNQIYALEKIFLDHGVDEYNFLVWRAVDKNYITYKHLNKDRIIFDVNHKLSQNFNLCDKPDPLRNNIPDGHYGADAHEQIFNWLKNPLNSNIKMELEENYIENIY